MTFLPTIKFMRWRHVMSAVSIFLVVGSIVSVTINGLALGLDFTGGTQVEVQYGGPAPLDDIRASLQASEYPNASAQHFGKPEEVLVRVPPVAGEEKDLVGNKVLALLQNEHPDVVLKRVEFVGPQVGEELRDQSGVALMMALGLMLLYVTFRFRFKFALGAVVALFHDVIITIGFFSVTRLTFDLTALAAVLAVIGYSLNDTIVVFDRVRENFRKDRAQSPSEIIDDSLNQTLSRTTMTSFTTLLVLIALALLGGEMIYSFAIALIAGIVVGTYSSIYVASNLLLVQNLTRDDFIEVETAADDMP